MVVVRFHLPLTMTNPFEALKQQNDAVVLGAELAGSGVVPGWPMHAVFEFTGACNLHCFMCGFEMLRDELREQGRTKFTMPVDMFRLIVKAAFPHIRTVNPTLGGEPFLVPYFDEFVHEVEKHGCKVEMYTNGMLMHGERLRALMPHLAHLTVSFDGATKATFEHVRGGADFDQILANVAEFAALRRELGLRRRVRFGFNVVIMRENLDELARIVEIAAANDVDVVTGCFVIETSKTVAQSSPTKCPARTNAALAEARATAARLGMRLEFPLDLPVEDGDAKASPSPPPPTEVSANASAAATPPEELPPISGNGPPPGYAGAYYCDMAWRKVFVGVNGEVMPCCSPTRPILGNAFQQPFEDIWNGAEYRRLREGLFSGQLTGYCRGCPYLQQAGALPYDSTPAGGASTSRSE
ncbi:MAG: radical SAM protein [Planctomycetota bacterium]